MSVGVDEAPRADTAPPEAPRKRGRPKGSKTRPAAERTDAKGPSATAVKSAQPVLPDDLAPLHEFVGELCTLLGEPLSDKEIARLNRTGAPVAAIYVEESNTVRWTLYLGALGGSILRRVAKLVIAAFTKKKPDRPAPRTDPEQSPRPVTEPESVPATEPKTEDEAPYVPAGDASTLVLRRLR